MPRPSVAEARTPVRMPQTQVQTFQNQDWRVQLKFRVVRNSVPVMRRAHQTMLCKMYDEASELMREIEA